MPQKGKTFQSKDRKFGNKDKGFSKGRSGASKSGFGENRSASRGRDQDAKPYKKREFGDSAGRPRSDKPYKSRSDRPYSDDRKPYNKDKSERKSYASDRPRGDRPYKSREDRPARPYSSDRKNFSSDRPRSDRPYKSREDRPARPYSEDRKPYKSREDRPERKSYSSDRPRGDRPYKAREDRPARPYSADRKSFSSDRPRNDRPYKSRDDRPERKSYEDRPRVSKTYQRKEDARPSASAKPRRDGKLEMAEKHNYGAPSSLFLYGVHAVAAAWVNPHRKVARLLVTEAGLAHLENAIAEARNLGLKRPEPKMVEKEDLDRLLPKDSVHQGILLDAEPLEETFLQDVLISAGDDAIVLVLDQVTDPHNVGAILRSAAAFGACAVVAQKLHAPEITGTLAKIASGAAEHVPLVREVNLSRAIDLLKKEGFFCIGLDEDGKLPLAETVQAGKTALVLGAEGDGLRRLVGETCDTLARLPTSGAIASLNVSNAAAISLYEVVRARK